MGPEGAINILYKRELEAADAPETLRAAKVAEFREKFANPYTAAARGFLDGIIEPRRTRPTLITRLPAWPTNATAIPPKTRQHSPVGGVGIALKC